MARCRWPDLTSIEKDFLDLSSERASSEARVLAERARRDARQNRQLRTLLAAVAVLVAASVVAGVLALAGREESGIAVPYDFERTRAIFEAANA